MKINPLDNIPGALKSGAAKRSEEAKETFEAALNNRLKNNQPPPTAHPDNTARIGINPFAEIARTGFLRADSVKKAEGLLFSLEMYKNALANTNIKPERLSGLLTDMREKSVEAIKSGQGLPDNDPLRDILSEVRKVITDEGRRFYSVE